MLDSPYYDYLVDQTHHHYKKLKRKSRRMELDTFAFGFVSHNEHWGADYTAHQNGLTTQEGYVVTKSKILAPKLRPQLEVIFEDAGIQHASLLAGLLASGIAHPLIETAIDLLIKRNENPYIGLGLFQSAQDRPPSIPDLLVVAYARDFVHHMKVSKEEAGKMIREAEREFQQMMILYGEILTKEESEAIKELADQGAALIEGYIESAIGKEANIPSEVFIEFIHLAIQQVEEDYSQEITATFSYLQRHKGISRDLKRILKSN
jgi:hypothetical protein